MRKRPDCDYNIHILTPPLVEMLMITPTQPYKFYQPSS